jgi:hypothetical protein
MRTVNLFRWGGLVALLAGLLFAVATAIHPASEDIAVYDNPGWIPAHLIGWVSVMLMQLGLVALYGRQAKEMGWLGLVGFVLALVGTAFAGAIQYLQSTVLPLIAAEAPGIFVPARTPPPYALPVFALGFGLGYVLLGIATIRAGVLPRWSGLLLSIGMLLFMFAEVTRESSILSGVLPYVIGTSGQAIFSLSLVWMGYALWSEKRLPAGG